MGDPLDLTTMDAKTPAFTAKQMVVSWIYQKSSLLLVMVLPPNNSQPVINHEPWNLPRKLLRQSGPIRGHGSLGSSLSGENHPGSKLLPPADAQTLDP